MITLEPEDAARFLVGHTGLAAVTHPAGAEGARALLAARRFIQLDPIDRIGTNADLVAWARVDGLGRGDVHHHNEGRAFEHFARVRCVLPSTAFPAYRARAAALPDWNLSVRLSRLDPAVIGAVRAELDARGPLTAAEMSDHGRVEQLDWSGWKGTGKAATMALEVLFTRCQVIVRGRRKGARLYDLPRRALPAADATGPTPADYRREGVLNRVEAFGLMPRAQTPGWSALGEARKDGTVDDLIAEGAIEVVTVRGSRRAYLAPAGFRDRTYPEYDDRVRILGPLDPLMWQRKLVQQCFGFEYLWEVYKPADQRRWGYYVCPLLYRGQLIGRIEGRVIDGELVIERRWTEPGKGCPEAAYQAAIERHAANLSR